MIGFHDFTFFLKKSSVKCSCILKKTFSAIPKTPVSTRLPWLWDSWKNLFLCLICYNSYRKTCTAFFCNQQLSVNRMTACSQSVLYLWKARIHLQGSESRMYVTAKLTCTCFYISQCVSSSENHSLSDPNESFKLARLVFHRQKYLPASQDAEISFSTEGSENTSFRMF